MYFYVIEGDNGTGKDSLAQKFQDEGFSIITYDRKIKKLEDIAKSKKGKDKILHFMAYNKACGDLAKEKRKNSDDIILVRYYISTLAAAYSDKVFSYEETMSLLKSTYCKFEKPDMIIRLKCENKERMRRIEERNSSDFDDRTLSRENRYRWITDRIKEVIDVNWIEIDTSNKSIKEVFDYTKALLRTTYKNDIERNEK